MSFWLRLSQQAGEDLTGLVWLTGLDAGSVSSQLNIVCLWLPRGTMALQTNAAAALTQQRIAPQWQARILFHTQKPQWGETF